MPALIILVDTVCLPLREYYLAGRGRKNIFWLAAKFFFLVKLAAKFFCPICCYISYTITFWTQTVTFMLLKITYWLCTISCRLLTITCWLLTIIYWLHTFTYNCFLAAYCYMLAAYH